MINQRTAQTLNKILGEVIMEKKTKNKLISLTLVIAIALTMAAFTLPVRAASLDYHLTINEKGVLKWDDLQLPEMEIKVAVSVKNLKVGETFKGSVYSLDTDQTSYSLRNALISGRAYDNTYVAKFTIYTNGVPVYEETVEYTLVLDKPRHKQPQEVRWNGKSIEWDASSTATKDTTYEVRFYRYNPMYKFELECYSVLETKPGQTSVKLTDFRGHFMERLESDSDSNYNSYHVEICALGEKGYYPSSYKRSESISVKELLSGTYHSEYLFHGSVSISCDSTPAAGNTISVTYGGDFSSSNLKTGEYKLYWQVKIEDGSWITLGYDKNNQHKWTIPTQARSRSVRAVVEIDSKYYNSTHVFSNEIYVPKVANTAVPTAPEVTIEDKEQAIYVESIGKQEYLVTTSNYAPSDAQWEQAVNKYNGGKLKLETSIRPGRMVYVWTRFRDDGFTYAGTETVYTAVYYGNDKDTTLVGTALKITKASNGHNAAHDNYRIGDTLKVTVSPCPSQASFDGFPGSTWGYPYGTKNSSYGTFYEDASCTTKLEDTKNYKTVYLKLANTFGNDLYITCGTASTNGATASINVADGDGNYAVGKIGIADVYLLQDGTKVRYPFTYSPLGCEEFLPNLKAEAQIMSAYAPKLSFESEGESSGVITIDASGDNCEPGVYTYYVMYGSSRKATVKVSVLNEEVVPVESISFASEATPCYIGQYCEPKLVLLPENAWGDISWTSSDESIATVSDKGYVFMSDRAKPGQQVMITARCGELSASCVVTAVDMYSGIDMKDCYIDIPASVAWTEGEVKPQFNVVYQGHILTEEKDYIAVFKNNTDIGTGMVNIYGIGECSGSVTKYFEIKNVSLKYRAYVQKKGWMNWVVAKTGTKTNSTIYAGTTDNLRMETIQMQLSGVSGEVRYRAYVQKDGWTQWATTKDTTTYAGTKGQVSNLYDIYYRTYCEKFGWLGWAGNNEKSGSAGYARKLEAFQVQFVAKGAKFNKGTVKAFYDKAKDGANP